MVRVLCGTILMLLTIGTVSAQQVSLSDEKKVPQYLLVTRSWGTIKVSDNMNGMLNSSFDMPAWVYRAQTFTSLNMVLYELNSYKGHPMTEEEKKNELVGLWILGEANNITDKVLYLEVTPHEKEVIKEKEAWVEYQWRLSAGQVEE